jgi:hypothetical protein
MTSIPNWHFTLSRYSALLTHAHSGHEATCTLEKTNDRTEKAFDCHRGSRGWTFACDGAERSSDWWLSAGNGRRGRQSCSTRISLLSRRIRTKIRYFRNRVSSADQAPQKDLHVGKVATVRLPDLKGGRAASPLPDTPAARLRNLSEATNSVTPQARKSSWGSFCYDDLHRCDVEINLPRRRVDHVGLAIPSSLIVVPTS